MRHAQRVRVCEFPPRESAGVAQPVPDGKTVHPNDARVGAQARRGKMPGILIFQRGGSLRHQLLCDCSAMDIALVVLSTVSGRQTF